MRSEPSSDKLKEELRELLKSLLSKEVIENLTSREVIEYHIERMDVTLGNVLNYVNRISKSLEEKPPEEYSEIRALLREILENCRKMKNIIKDMKSEELIEDLLVKEVKVGFIKNLEELIKLIKDIGSICSKIEEELKMKLSGFLGREEELLRSIIGKVVKIEEALQELKSESYTLYGLLQSKRPWKGPPEVLDLLRSIELGERVWIQDIITKITGLRSVAGDLYLEEVKLEGDLFQLNWKEDRSPTMTIDQLLLRYPPFEPIQISVNGVRGRFVWFVESHNATIPISVSDMVEIDEASGRLMSVKPMDLLSKSSKDQEITIKVKTTKGKRGIVFIKYGSKNLYDRMRSKSLNEIQEEYEKFFKQRNRKAYSVSNLGYAWYCILGRGLSTDPYDWRCPFMNKCAVGRSQRSRRRGCDKWSWSRKLFPKVFVASERSFSFSPADMDVDNAFGFIRPFAIKGVRVYELYRSAQWHMPSIVLEGPLVEVIFKRPIRKNLLRTNAIGFEIPLSILKAIMNSLLDKDIPHKPEVTIVYPAKKISLDKLLISKYYIYKATKGGLDSFSFLERNTSSIIKSFEKFYHRVSKEELRKDLLDYLINSLGHTLAHLLFAYISNNLEIELDNLLYVFKVDEKSDNLLIAVIENSVWGSLDMVKHAKSKFGSLHNMVQRFVNDSIRFLEAHENEIESFLEKRGAQVGERLSNIVSKVREMYGQLVDSGIILDSTMFLNHLVLSREDQVLAKEIAQNVREVREWLIDAIPASGINTCIDGCTACLILERGCTTPLLQNILLSRNLALWVLRVLSGREPIKGRGRILGKAFFNQARKRFFAFSPYIDEEGVELLTELAQKGVEVVLITNESCALKYQGRLKESGIALYALKTPRHDKYYIIDRQVLIRTSQNLSNFASINEFSLEYIGPEKAEKIESQDLKGGNVVPY
jgi:hypothetical protein